MSTTESFQYLLDIMDQLREKCPWDREQTFESLRNLTIEEVFELADAVLAGNADEIKKEVGDVLLHVVFYAKLGSETGAFDMKDVIDGLIQKLVYRHPHVFGDASVNNVDEVMERWEQLKLKEKEREVTVKKTVLGGIPSGLPAMIKANRIQQKARAVGFDWEKPHQVWDKVKEEISELEDEFRAGNMQKAEQEMGDLFFSLINVARLYNIDPETALEKTNLKFKRRFEYLEQQTIAKGVDLKSLTLQEMDVYWNEAKRFDR